MARKNEVAAQIMEHLCTHDWHGYSQVVRNGCGHGTETLTIDGKNYTFNQGDRDCSSAVIDAYATAGVDCGGATYTGNMRRCMTTTGNFEWKPMSYTAQRGDIYLNEVNHTAMCVSAVPDMLAEFSISETGGIHGVEGDQTGRESSIKPYYDYPWNGILRYTGKADGQPQSEKQKASQIPGSPKNDLGLWYQAHVQNLGWLPAVHDGQTAGTTTFGLRMEALKIDPRILKKKYPDLVINVKAHISGIGWKEYKNISHDTIIGTVGQSRAIEAIDIEILGINRKLSVQVHLANTGWTGSVPGGFTTGSTGLSKSAEAIRMYIL